MKKTFCLQTSKDEYEDEYEYDSGTIARFERAAFELALEHSPLVYLPPATILDGRSMFGVRALRVRGIGFIPLNAAFVSIEAIYKTGQHRHNTSKHLFARANPIGRDEALCD